jgi:hypothetical protein
VRLFCYVRDQNRNRSKRQAGERVRKSATLTVDWPGFEGNGRERA